MNNKTLWSIWKQHAQNNPDGTAIVHWVAGEGPFVWTYKNLLETAEKFSRLVYEKGIKPGEVCAIIIKHNPMFYPLYLGISGAGALPAILAYPNPRLHPDKFRQGLSGMSQRSGLDHIFTQREMDSVIRPFFESDESTVKDMLFPFEFDFDSVDLNSPNNEIDEIRKNINEDQPVLLQHSSGTTGLQKPVVLSHKAISQHVDYLAKSLKLSNQDKIVSWLPLYHDMGLIACFHLPLVYGMPTIQLDPFEWVIAPDILMDATSKEKATIAWLPNFAYNLMAEKIRLDDLEDVSLSSLRLIINCSEPVRSESFTKFVKAFKTLGIKDEMLSASYGMAETTFAVTQTEPDKRPTELVVDRNKLSQGVVEFPQGDIVTRTCVSSGNIVEGCQVKIVDSDRKEIKNTSVGEIAVKSVSMFDGYRNYPEKTAEVLDNDGWYYTGDYGFMHEEELFVIGRKKDIIIVAGKNVYPEDIEDALSKVNDIIPGRVIAFGEEDATLGTEQISVIAETKLTEHEELRTLKTNIIKVGMGIDINIHSVYLVPPRWLIKSSAGKPSRKANKDRIINKNDKSVWS